MCEMKILSMKLVMVIKIRRSHKKYRMRTPSLIFTNSLLSIEIGMRGKLIYLLEERSASGDALEYAYCILYMKCEANP